MSIATVYLFFASMGVDPDKETLFNEVDDTEHTPNLLKVPGVYAVTRLKGEAFTVSIGGTLADLLATSLRCAPEQQSRYTGERHVRSDHPAGSYL